MIGFGYDLSAGLISIGAAGKSSEQSGVCFAEFKVPELINSQHDHRYIYVGGAPVLYQDGSEAGRSCWGKVQPVAGQFTAEGYLTRGKLTQLMQEVQ